MRIVVTADDFGYDDDSVGQTIAALEEGAVCSASIMAMMPASAQAMAYARQRTDLSFGVHLVFCTDTVERPILPTEEISALVAGNNRFLPSNRVRLLGLLNRLPSDQIAREMKAQIGYVRDHGVRIDYVDSHGHLHKLLPFQRALVEVLPQFGRIRVRRAQDVFLGRSPLRLMAYAHPFLNAAVRRSGFSTTDCFFMPDPSCSATWPSDLLRWVVGRKGTLEVGVHPGHNENWRREESTQIRQFARLSRAAGHELIGWSKIPA